MTLPLATSWRQRRGSWFQAVPGQRSIHSRARTVVGPSTTSRRRRRVRARSRSHDASLLVVERLSGNRGRGHGRIPWSRAKSAPALAAAVTGSRDLRIGVAANAILRREEESGWRTADHPGRGRTDLGYRQTARPEVAMKRDPPAELPTARTGADDQRVSPRGAQEVDEVVTPRHRVELDLVLPTEEWQDLLLDERAHQVALGDAQLVVGRLGGGFHPRNCTSRPPRESGPSALDRATSTGACVGASARSPARSRRAQRR